MNKLSVGILLLSTLLLLVSCGGSSSDTNEASTLPPDPGTAGLETLAGVDSDNDGVRDDIQRWIALENDDLPEETKERLKSLTNGYVTLMVNENAANEIKQKFLKDDFCIQKDFESKDRYLRYLSKLSNTKERMIQAHRIIYQDFQWATDIRSIKCDQ